MTPTSTPPTPPCVPTANEPYCIHSNEDEQTIVAHVLLQEGGTLYGKPAMQNIAQVIRNRVAAPGFPKTILGVISANGKGAWAFDAYTAASSRERSAYWLDANDVAEHLIRNDALSAAAGMENADVLYFHSCAVPFVAVEGWTSD